MKLDKNSILKKMDKTKVPGISLTILQNGKLEAKECFGHIEANTQDEVKPNTIFNACSMSKFVTALLVLRLVDEGILDLDEDVNVKLKSWTIPYSELQKSEVQNNEKVTLRHLLAHQGGLTDAENSFSEYRLSAGVPTMLDILEGKTAYHTKPALLTYKPGSDFVYSDLGYCIIEQLVEDVLLIPFKKALEDLVLKPLDMDNSTLDWKTINTDNRKYACGHNKTGSVLTEKHPIYPYSASAGLWSTPSDLSLLLFECFHALNGKSKLGITVKTAKDMITPQGVSKHTGLGVFLDRDKAGIELSSFGWGLGFQCMIIAYPEIESGTVIMTNSNLGVHQLKGIIGQVFEELALVYKWR